MLWQQADRRENVSNRIIWELKKKNKTNFSMVYSNVKSVSQNISDAEWEREREASETMKASSNLHCAQWSCSICVCVSLSLVVSADHNVIASVSLLARVKRKENMWFFSGSCKVLTMRIYVAEHLISAHCVDYYFLLSVALSLSFRLGVFKRANRQREECIC